MTPKLVIYFYQNANKMEKHNENQLSLFKLGYTTGIKVDNPMSNVAGSGSSRYRITNDGELLIKPRTYSKKEEAKKATDVRKLTMNKPKVKAKIIAFSRAKIGSLKMKFVTITFPSGCSDDICMQCLNTWLTKLRSITSSFEYLWVAERQANGTLHFHLFTKTFFNIRVINYHMAVTIDNVLSKNKEGVPAFSLEKYNGIDVKVVDKISNIVKYVTKYVTKTKELNYNKSWACSRLVSRLFTHIALSQKDMLHCLNHSKKVFEHECFEYHDGTVMSVSVYVPKEGAFMPYVSYIDAVNDVVLMYEG